MVAEVKNDLKQARLGTPILNNAMLPREPPAIPPGWQISPPDFVGVGAMKSGTTWWWSMLIRHPDIASPREHPGGEAEASKRPFWAKEVHFFNHYGRIEQIDPTSYHRYFPRPAGCITGEWTPRYMYDFWVPPLLRAAAPAAKILVILRDPLARFVSGLGHHLKFGTALTAPVMEHQFHRGLYWRQMRNLLGHFQRDQVLVLQYEQCLREPARQAARTFEFLGVDPDRWRLPADSAKRVGLECPVPSVDQATLRAVWQATEPDTTKLLDDFPEIDQALWPCLDRSHDKSAF